MNNTSIISIVRSFTKGDIKSFDDFVKSPYFNKKSAVIKLWDVIKRKAPAFKDEELKRENLYLEVFPDKSFNYGTMKNLIFELTKLAEKFLELEFYKEDDYFNYYYELGGLLSKGQMKQYASRCAEIEKHLADSTEFDGENYDKLFNLKWFKLEYIYSNIAKDASKKEVFLISKYLIYDFIIKLIKSYINEKGIELEYNYKEKDSVSEKFFDHIDFEDFIRSIEPDSEKDSRILSVHYKLYRSVSSPENLSYYYDYKESLLKNTELFSIDERRVLYSGLRIALIFVSFHNNINYDAEIFGIYKVMLEDGAVLNYYGNIELIVFANYIAYASRAGDAGFITSFLSSYLEKIPEEHRENMKLFGEANIYYIENDYDKSLEVLLKVDEKIIRIKRASKNLEMMIHYERNDYDSFLYTSDSYKHFISRNKSIPKNAKTGIMNTVNYVNRLFRLREKSSRAEREKLTNEIRKEKIAIKGWLLEKIKEIK